MSNNLHTGYKDNFLVDHNFDKLVPLPIIHRMSEDVAPVMDRTDGLLNYINYSLKLSQSRKFAFFSASNIDGKLFCKAQCPTNWKKDRRAIKYQWGYELYGAPQSDFDRGHMTKREDVQWGESSNIAQEAVNNTFYYSNAAPQHRKLNQVIWKRLENYILHTEARKNALKICVFTGPLLLNTDPPLSIKIRDQIVKIPIIFWKVVVFRKSDNKLYRVGFLMSQRKILTTYGVVEELESHHEGEQLFEKFDNANTYQVEVPLIERLSGLKFATAIDIYTDNRPIELILEQIDILSDLESKLEYTPAINFRIHNIIL